MTGRTPGAQRWDPENYRKNASFVSELAGPVLDLLGPVPGERILDLGCGEGTIAQILVEGGCDVVAVDASQDQVAAARRRGLDARVADATALDFAGEFDAVFSNAVLHWVKDADAAIAGVRRALKPGGRFVAEFGGHGNVAAIVAGLEKVLGRRGIDAKALNPWYFPTPDAYARKLEAAGFRLAEIGLHPRPTPLPGDIAGWLETLAQPFVDAMPAVARPAMLSELAADLAPVLQRADGVWTADYVRLRVAADVQR